MGKGSGRFGARPGVKRAPLTMLEINTLQMLSEDFRIPELVRPGEKLHALHMRLHRMRLKLDAFTTWGMVTKGLERGLIKMKEPKLYDFAEVKLSSKWNFFKARRAFSIRYFDKLLKLHNGKVGKVAKSSGVNRQACYALLRRLGLLPAACPRTARPAPIPATRRGEIRQIRRSFEEFVKEQRQSG